MTLDHHRSVVDDGDGAHRAGGKGHEVVGLEARAVERAHPSRHHVGVEHQRVGRVGCGQGARRARGHGHDGPSAPIEVGGKVGAGGRVEVVVHQHGHRALGDGPGEGAIGERRGHGDRVEERSQAGQGRVVARRAAHLQGYGAGDGGVGEGHDTYILHDM